MAKLNHVLFGQAKGKVGGMVLQRYEGMNIVREKPISVKNPQSTKQTQQRAKFKLASQIVAEYSDVIKTRLSKLSIYTRMRRSIAVNAAISAITMDGDDRTNALIASVISAINAKNSTTLPAPECSYDSNTNTMQITAEQGDVVVADILQYDETGKAVSREVMKFTSTGAIKSSDAINADSACMMVVALRADTDEGRATIANLEFGGDSWLNTITRSAAAGDLTVSEIGYAIKNA